MVDDPFYKPGLRVAPPQPTPGEHVWTLRKGVEEMRAELRSHGDYGWECQLFRDGVFIYGRRWNLHQSALEEAADHRRGYEAEGWTEAAKPGAPPS